MIVTDDDRIADEARIYRDQGKAAFLANFHTRLGYNWRMSEPHAAIALASCGRLDEFIAHRQSLAKRYDAALGRVGLLTPLAIPTTARCNYYKYVAFLPDGVDRAALKQALRDELRRRAVGRGLRHAAAPCSRCSRRSPTGAAARRRAAVRPPHLPAVLPGAHRRAGATSSSSRSPECWLDERCEDWSPSPAAPASSARTSSTRCWTPATRSACSTTRPPQRADVDWADVDMLDHDRLTERSRGIEAGLPPRGHGRRERHLSPTGRERRLNTLGAARVLEAARRADAGRVILASTVWVYAATHGDVVDETTPFDPDTDRHLYVSTKIAAEMLCRDYHTLFGRPYTVLRYGIPFGPRMRDDLVVAAFFQRAMRGEPLRIDGDGAQERCFVYVEDLARRARARARRPSRRTARTTSRRRADLDPQLAETVRDLVGDVEVTFGPSRPGDLAAGSSAATAPATTGLGSDRSASTRACGGPTSGTSRSARQRPHPEARTREHPPTYGTARRARNRAAGSPLRLCR